MTPNLKSVSFVALVLSIGLASAASAIDLTGTCTGRLSCTGLDAAGEATKVVVSDSELLVSQDGTDLLATIDALPFAGTVVSSTRDAERRGVATLTACNNDGDVNGRVETARLVARLSSDSNKLGLKLSSVRGTGGALECSGSFRRVDEVEPVVSECPVLYACVCAGISGGDYGCGNGGAGGNRGDLDENVSESFVDLYYVNGNETGWVCVAQ